MKLFFSIATALISYLVYGFLVAQYEITQLPKDIERPHPAPFYDYKGVTNVHSNVSIGSGDYHEIIESAKFAGLDYIFITDLNVFEETNIIEGYHDNLLVLQAGKYSFLDSRLLYYSKEVAAPAPNLGELQVKLSDLLSQPTKSNKDISIVLTHPLRKGFSWSGDLPIGLDGMEVINYKSIQQSMWDESKLSSLWSLIIFPFNQKFSFLRLFSDPTPERVLWDTINKNRILVGHLGLEATARAIPYTGKTINFPSYEMIFSIGSQHLILKSELTGNVSNDKMKILKALKAGEFYFSLDILGDPKGFNLTLEDGDRSYLMGSEIKLKKGLTLKYRIPLKPRCDFDVLVFRNGEKIKSFSVLESNIPIEQSGSYRVLVRLFPDMPFPDQKKAIPWIYSNPILIKE